MTGFTPTSGPEAGGTTVTITGRGFVVTGARVTKVAFGSNDATSIRIVSGTEIIAISPPGTGSVHIVVTSTLAGEVASADRFTYTPPAPTVTSITPTSGPEAGGTVVAITGTGFTGATAVKFGATAATSFTVNSATSITATAPAGAGTVDVTVTTPVGTSATSAADRFTYTLPVPTVTSITPTSGPEAGGTVVTISGTNLANASAVTFGTSAARITANSATSLTVTSPAGTGTVDVRVTTPGGTVSPGRFSYVAAPTAASLSPSSGPEAGGTVVTISGTNLADASAVTFGTSAARITANSATSLTVTSPAGTGTVDVRVTTPGGTVSPGRFTYVGAPTAASLSPSSGPEAGGTVVTISGTNLADASAVTFGTSMARITANSATSLTVTSPAGTGTVDVRVTTPGGTVSPGRFTYVGAPTAASLSPSSGPEAGGTVVTISGSNLANASAVTFGTSMARITANSATSLTVTSPAGTGTVDVTVTTAGGTVSPGRFTYVGAPTAASLSPTSGPEAGGTVVTISGSNLANASAVTFGTSMARITANTATSLTVTSPAGTGVVDVRVTTPGGTVSPGRFSYVGAPTAASLSPTSGPEAGGTVVTISGSNLANASAVTFGTSMARITANSATSLTVTSPAGTGTVDVTVTTPGGTVSPGRFTYVGAPTAASLSPTSGPEAGGTVVTISGSNLANASAVTFGTSMARITANSATSLTVTSPAGTGTVDVTVTTPGGTVSPGRFTYVGAPTAASLSPTSGPEAGGTVVTIAGSNLANASAVTFGTSMARITANTATSLTVTSPAGTGTVDVTVTTAGGTVSPGRFTYVGAPTAASLSPTSGPEAGGTVVTISGSNLANASAVTFGTSMARITANTATSITVTSPAGKGAVTVTMTTPGGNVSPGTFTYIPPAPSETKTTIMSSQNPSSFGQAVTFTVTVTAIGAGTPAGTVTFRDGDVQIGASFLSAAGVATLMTKTLSVGNHSITAAYAGGPAFNASISSPLTQSVNIPADSTKLRQLQVDVTKVVAQNSGQAISSAIDTAISEGFSDGGRCITPGPTGLRLNLTVPCEDELQSARPSASAYAREGAPGRASRDNSSIDDVFAAVESAKVASAKVRAQNNWLFWIDTRGTSIDRWASPGNFGAGATQAALYGTQFNTLAGLTYKIAPDFLVGAVGGYESFQYTMDSISGRLKGDGWTAGSYLGWRITPALRYDAAVTFSNISYNGTAGAAQGSFSGQRWLLTTGLTGSHQWANFHLEPSTRLYILREREGAYIDTLGTKQAAYNFFAGRASAGTKLTYPVSWSDGLLLSPYVGGYADYYFTRDNAAAVIIGTSVPQIPIQLQGWSARFTGGVDLRSAGGATLGVGAELGGIGGNTRIWTFSGRAQVPF
ncbi:MULTISPECIES: IPT/TIG domain-containing protein [unclassified Bradyrhizobium]|uniref:IPT/TIG domain-containing protein n=1 Tax=Bradyrhizobium sp. USDA 4538 TaxID=2817702 RepID=UPI0028126CE9|nr:IPT/TIG domain-containing protein [Bradyrhizobium sp. USDA 4538]